ncbi:MAG: DEAD/DEAH box helicase family protein [Spirochaetaceae bacterium]|jgi:uncharacterized Zn finger protein/superfamily II DNA or RNA helicase|nr:DEAD/DEAH box helicase family protein [Spirochaetaceae bacterium]
MAKNSYGVTPWGKWFMEILDGYRMGERLDRGRRYANAGNVVSLEIKGRRVTAKVRGRRRSSYTVIIDFPRLQEPERVLALLEGDPALLAEIASGKLPEAFLRKLKRSGLGLIPARWNDMSRACNCPDYGDPCKHMAALYFILAQEVDADPHLLFRLRGVDLSEVTGRFGGSLDNEIAPPFRVTEAPRRAASGRAGEAGRTGAGGSENPPAEFSVPAIPQCAGLICSLLPASPPFCERDFALVMAEFYHHAARFLPWQGEADSPEDEHRCSRSRWTVDCESPRPGTRVFLIQEDARGEVSRHGLFESFLRFRGFSSGDGTGSYAFLFNLFRLLNLLCAAGAVIPCVYVDKGRLRIVWMPFEMPLAASALDALASGVEAMLPLVKPGRPPKIPRYADGGGTARLLASAFLGEWVRQSGFTGPAGAAYRELNALFFRGGELDVRPPRLRSLPLSIDRWLSVLRTDFSAWKYRFSVGPAKPASPAAGEAGFALSVEVAMPSPEAAPPRYVPLKDAAKISGGIDILKAPTALSNYLPEIRALFSRKTIGLTEKRLVDFLDSGADLLERLGIEVILPRSLHRELKPRLVIKAGASGKGAGSLVSYFNLDSFLEWDWQVAIGDDLLSPEEFAALLTAKKRFVKFRERFVRIDPDELARLLKKTREGSPGVNEFLKSHFAGDSVLSFDAERLIGKVFEEKSFPAPQGLKAPLRPYQERGYNWLCSLLYAGFGCILADDMGLGKTIQAIAVLLRLKADGRLGDQVLVVAPAALLENWDRELARFAPALKVSRYHGPGRRLDRKSDIFLTTYQTAARDREKLVKRGFSVLIADEAHLMKNAATEGAKAVKSLRADCRLALSGTPVENRLEDMRSLFDFVLPGYLGTPAQFRDAYRIPIEVLRSREKAEALKRITAPFLLRRLKTDKTVIADLPEKIIINEYPGLESEQAALYETVLTGALERSERLEDPAGRSALVLNLLLALKQICDHPRVYDKESPAVAKLSGKALLLLTLLEEIIAAREKVLVFSQYVETLHCLETIIRGELGEIPLLYYGGMSQKKRGETLDSFQNDVSRRILLISLKAGGLGLNLTAANRVIHYDLWYNPAVENQATDRVFRIGQEKNVFVYRFITRNSFEEKIDLMLSAKRELAEMSVSSGESWLARMSHEELRELFA